MSKQRADYYANFPKTRMPEVKAAFVGAGLTDNVEIGYLEELGGYVKGQEAKGMADVFNAFQGVFRNIRTPATAGHPVPAAG